MTARFLSTDPVGFVESGGDPAYFNRYAYVINDPVNAVDPDGRTPLGLQPPFREETLKYLTPEERAEVEEAEFQGGLLALTLITSGTATVPLRMAAMRSTAPRGFAQSGNLIRETTKGFARTGGRSGRTTFQSFGNGGQKGVERLFNTLTKGNSKALEGGGRLGKLADGSAVQISTKYGVTSVRITQNVSQTGSRIKRTKTIKVRFEKEIE